MNKASVAECYFEKNNFAVRIPEIVREIADRTGFVVQDEIFRGQIYDASRVRTLIVKGVWQGKGAVLKIQGLKPEFEEADHIRHFTQQNRSALIRAVDVYVHDPWQNERGYGFMIAEHIDGSPLFQMPGVYPQQMQEWVRVYQDYIEHARPSHAWIPCAFENFTDFARRRITAWERIARVNNRIDTSVWEPLVSEYLSLVSQYGAGVPLEFGHGHFSAHDVVRVRGGQYVLFSQMFWGWKPRYHEIAFMLWACIMHMNTEEWNADRARAYVTDWDRVLLPIFHNSAQQRNIFALLMMERMVGTLLADLSANEQFAGDEHTQTRAAMTSVAVAVFHYFHDQIKN